MPTAPQWPPKWPLVGWECVPRTTSGRIPTQHPETSAEAHTELARAEFPVIGGAAMTRRRRLQYHSTQAHTYTQCHAAFSQKDTDNGI